jgi:hypothetical protein
VSKNANAALHRWLHTHAPKNITAGCQWCMLAKERRTLKRKIYDLANAARAFQALSVVYRTGARPSGVLFQKLDKAKKTLEENRDV